jgi:hypothetical protein
MLLAVLPFTARPLRPLRPPVDMIKLNETREITPYLWVHPDEEWWAGPGSSQMGFIRFFEPFKHLRWSDVRFGR